MVENIKLNLEFNVDVTATNPLGTQIGDHMVWTKDQLYKENGSWLIDIDFTAYTPGDVSIIGTNSTFRYISGAGEEIILLSSPVLNWIRNTAPSIDTGGPYQAYEGEVLTFDASGTTDYEDDTLEYNWSMCGWSSGWSNSALQEYMVTDNAELELTLEVSDGLEMISETTTVTILNVNPEITVMEFSQNGVDISDTLKADKDIQVDLSLQLQDGYHDTNLLMVNWGNADIKNIEFSDGNLNETVELGTTYIHDGIYNIEIILIDDDLAFSLKSITLVVGSVVEETNTVIETNVVSVVSTYTLTKAETPIEIITLVLTLLSLNMFILHRRGKI